MARRMARTRRVSKPSFCFVPFIFNLPESSGTLLLPQTEGVSLLTSLFFSLLTFPPLFLSAHSCSLLFSCLLFGDNTIFKLKRIMLLSELLFLFNINQTLNISKQQIYSDNNYFRSYSLYSLCLCTIEIHCPESH